MVEDFVVERVEREDGVEVEREDVDEVMNEHLVGIEGGEDQFCRSLLSMMSCK